MLKDGRIVFISDIHMGSEEGLNPGSPLREWGWLGKDRAKVLGKYLKGLATESDVTSVVVLGDLFDDWVVPAQLPPVEGDTDPEALLRAIARARQNKPIQEGFLALASAGKELRYVRGNHDMFLTDEILQDWVPAFECEPDEDGPGTGAYVIDGLLRAEHGCAYCLVNAPYMQGGEYRYPAGYYLARMDAYDNSKTGHGVIPLVVFLKMFRDFKPSERVGKSLLATADLADMARDLKFVMNSDYPGDITVASVAKNFMDWAIEWDKRGYPVSSKDAFSAELLRLNTIMRKVWLEKGGVKIGICGHTHVPKLRAYPNTNQDPDRPSNYVYANTGAWVDKMYPTCVEVEISQAKNRADVRSIRLFKTRPPRLLAERFVHIHD